MSIAENVLSARIASAKGDSKTAIELLRKAVEVEDSLAYDEPPAWFLPVREMLGGALLKQRRLSRQPSRSFAQTCKGTGATAARCLA